MKILSRPSFWRRAVRALGSRLFHWAENNADASIARNGEAWLLDALFKRWAQEPNAGRVVIDAGANVGDFTAAVLSAADQWRITTRQTLPRYNDHHRADSRL